MAANKRNQHFVPRFYLRAFESASSRINVYSFTRNLAFRDGPTKGQCFSRRIYGPDDTVEDQLCKFEGAASPIISRVIATGTAPNRGTEDREGLLRFVALQLLRTQSAAAKLHAFVNSFVKAASRGDPRFNDEELESVRILYDNPALLSLSFAEDAKAIISDLAMAVLRTGESRLITSDNPVFKYNQYCEDITGYGITGIDQRGLQMFLPLSPQCLLILFDREIYRAEVPTGCAGNLGRSTVDVINMMQAINASETLLFSEWSDEKAVIKLANRSRKLRHATGSVIQELPSESDPTRSLLHGYEAFPRLHLDLPFLRVRRDARRTPLKDRIRMVRHERSNPEAAPLSLAPGTRFIHRVAGKVVR